MHIICFWCLRNIWNYYYPIGWFRIHHNRDKLTFDPQEGDNYTMFSFWTVNSLRVNMIDGKWRVVRFCVNLTHCTQRNADLVVYQPPTETATATDPMPLSLSHCLLNSSKYTLLKKLLSQKCMCIFCLSRLLPYAMWIKFDWQVDTCHFFLQFPDKVFLDFHLFWIFLSHTRGYKTTACRKSGQWF